MRHPEMLPLHLGSGGRATYARTPSGLPTAPVGVLRVVVGVVVVPGGWQAASRRVGGWARFQCGKVHRSLGLTRFDGDPPWAVVWLSPGSPPTRRSWSTVVSGQPSPGLERDLRAHRDLLQPRTPPQRTRRPQPRTLLGQPAATSRAPHHTPPAMSASTLPASLSTMSTMPSGIIGRTPSCSGKRSAGGSLRVQDILTLSPSHDSASTYPVRPGPDTQRRQATPRPQPQSRSTPAASGYGSFPRGDHKMYF